MTSNVGADILNKVEGEISPGTRKAVMKRFSDPDIRFPLEFLNRIEEIVMFVSIRLYLSPPHKPKHRTEEFS